jgi:hypothetical protein
MERQNGTGMDKGKLCPVYSRQLVIKVLVIRW